jgi:cyclophilin family peptidyl-prolyl cis-trans isomerase
MHLNRILFTTVLAGTLIFAGAGCGQGDVAVPAPQANSDSNIELRAQNLQNMPPADAGGQTVAPAPEPEAQTAPQAPTQPEAQTQPMPQPNAPTARPTQFPGILPAAEIHNKQARIVTDKGIIIFKLFDGDAPKTVSNFVALAKSGFYDGLTFHRVVSGFVIQGGDPLGDGRGGPGYKFEDEPVTRDYLDGTVAMANSGPNTNGSQFFICLGDQPGLPKNYTIFGQVTSGLDVSKDISVGDVMRSVTIEDVKK